MTSPMPQFNRWARLDEITQQIGVHIAGALTQAHAEGARDGIELAAQICDSVVIWIRNLPENEINPGHYAQIGIVEFVRDQIRLTAHQIPDAQIVAP